MCCALCLCVVGVCVCVCVRVCVFVVMLYDVFVVFEITVFLNDSNMCCYAFDVCFVIVVVVVPMFNCCLSACCCFCFFILFVLFVVALFSLYCCCLVAWFICWLLLSVTLRNQGSHGMQRLCCFA